MGRLKRCVFCRDGKGVFYVVVKASGLERRDCPICNEKNESKKPEMNRESTGRKSGGN